MGRRNPTVGTHPDLFEPFPTRIAKPLDEMTEEEIAALPRSAFSDEEWDELDNDLRATILQADRRRRKQTKRSDFSDEKWDELDAETQEEIRADDPESQARIKRMVAEFVKRHEWAHEPDTNYMQESFEGDFDYWFSEMGHDAAGFIERGYGRRPREQLDELRQKFAEDGFSFEQIDAAFNEAMQDRDNWDFSYDTDQHGSAFFKASATESFYIDQHDLRQILEGMYDDEIEQALEAINRETYLSLDLDDIEKAADKYGIEIQEYAEHYADADPDWDKIEEAISTALEDVEGEGKGPAALDESRIVYRFDDGSFVYDLLASELPAEGRGRALCVGSRQYDFIDSVERGTNKIFSMRDADGKRIFTIQAIMKADGELGYIGQVRGDNNRFPTVDEIDWVLEFLMDGLKIPWRKVKDIKDLKPSLRDKGLIKVKQNPEDDPSEDYHCGFCADYHQRADF